jgi:RHS repeat-associated protein
MSTTNFTAYISPYLVVNNGGLYTKHMYVGSQRIMSKLASSDIFAVNPTDAKVTKATYTGNTLNFATKYNTLTATVKARYDSLGVVYNGTPQSSANLITATSAKISTPQQYFYHSDHLGSANYITDANGDVSQHLEFIASGEVFVDERFNNWHTPFAFNGKEQDEETGLSYFSARYLDKKTGGWLSRDPKQLETPNVGSYVFCHGNPVNRIDPDGMADFYTKSGSWLGADGQKDNKVFTADGINQDGTFNNANQLSGTHTEFQKSSNVVRQESHSTDSNEDLWIAHTANNAKGSKSLYQKLMSSYSSVGDKSALSTSNNSGDAQRARAAVIDVLSGGADPTGGATLWDGTDFIAWGLKSPNGTPQNKFEEYKSIAISKDIYSAYLKYQTDKYGNSVKYGKSKYVLPAQVFNNKNNWAGGSFFYNTGEKMKYGLKATGSFGGSIFWKTEK